VVISQGEVWWADLGEPVGSAPGFRRPVLIVQGDALNRSALATVVCVPLTSQLKWADAPGNVVLKPPETKLSKPSVANASQIVALDRGVLRRRVGRIPQARLASILLGIDVVLGRLPG
jgi:mRNA interferase MazF